MAMAVTRATDQMVATATGFAPDVAVELEASMDHFNGDHADTILLLAQLGSPPSDATGAAFTHVDPEGVDLVVHTPRGAVPVRLDFGERLERLDLVEHHVYDMIARARATVGTNMPLTSIERELASTAQLPTHVTTVDRIRDLSPNLREITVRGGLEAFRSLGGDQFLLVHVDRPTTSAIVDGFTMQRFAELDEDQRPARAYYTVRRWRPQVQEMDLWFVLHDHEESVAGWASRAQPGDRMALWGPRSSYEPPAATTSHLLVGDETALPAIAAILEGLDDDHRVDVVVETVDCDHVIDLPATAGTKVHWVFRGADAPGTGIRLLNAVRDLDLPSDGLYSFGGGESPQMAALRRHLRHERGMPANMVRMTGYWRREIAPTPPDADGSP